MCGMPDLAPVVPMVGMAGVFSVVLAKMIEEQKETVGAARVTRQISILICGVLKMMFQPSLHRG